MSKNKKLTVFNKNIIPVYTTDTGEKIVIGRELHENLSIDTPYRVWFPRMGEYGFVEEIDYYEYFEKVGVQKSTHASGEVHGQKCPHGSEKVQSPKRERTYEQKNHYLKLDMAKHIAMIQRTPQGFKIRQKLIELENTVAELPVTELERLKVEAQKERARAMLLNAQNRTFKTIASMVGDEKLSAIAGEVFGLKAIEEITGINMGKYLPECAETYSATEIGEKLGISANKVGKLANQYNLKTDEYGVTVMDKSRYSAKEVPNFRYYAAVLPVLESIVRN
jgi:Phage anti-repressor protein